MTAPDDLGFDKLLADDGLLVGLLGKTSEGRNRKALYGPDLPVVLLVGGPGTGKSRLLSCVRARFGTYTPTALVDCDSAAYRGHAGQHDTTRSEVTETLREIALQFRAWEGHGGRVATPRLYAGLAAIASSDGLAAASTLVDEVRRHDELLPPGSFWGGVFRRAVREYLAALGGLVAGPMAVPLSAAVVGELFDRASKDGQTTLRACFGTYPNGGGLPQLGLRKLASDFQAGGATRVAAENFLFRALREDLEAAYVSLGGRARRVSRPALLLDHADNALGRRLLTAVLQDREAGHHDRLVVIATACREDGGRFLHHYADGVEPGDSAGGRRPDSWSPSEGPPPAWSRPTGDTPGRPPLSRGALLVRMPMLTRDQQRWVTARSRGDGQRNDDTAARLLVDAFVHRLSAGRPLVVSRLAESHEPPGRTTDPTLWTLLDSRLPPEDDAGEHAEPRVVADVLLDELISARLPEKLPPQHRGRWLDMLSHLSVAHDVACAQTLLRRRLTAGNDSLSAYQIDELLEDAGWPRCPHHFIGDFGLRHLLMRRLYHLRTDGRAWHDDHALLLGKYESLEPESPDELFGTAAAHAMNHRLLSDPGNAATVTRYLERGLRSRPAREWAGELLAIAHAPVIGGEDDLRARALGEIPAEGEALHRQVARLLHTLRLCEDHAQAADEAVSGELRPLLQGLGVDFTTAAPVLTRLARDWSERAVNRQPLRPCACTRHIG